MIQVCSRAGLREILRFGMGHEESDRNGKGFKILRDSSLVKFQIKEVGSRRQNTFGFRKRVEGPYSTITARHFNQTSNLPSADDGI